MSEVRFMTIVTPQMGLFENPYCTKSVNEKPKRALLEKKNFGFASTIELH